jgi:hypothetical protein
MASTDLLGKKEKYIMDHFGELDFSNRVFVGADF